MTDVKGLTKIGVRHKLFPRGDTFAYVNEYGMLINVVEAPCGFDAYMDIENKYDAQFDTFKVTEDVCKSFIHFETMDEVADYSNKLIYKCRVYDLYCAILVPFFFVQIKCSTISHATQYSHKVF